MASTTVPRQRVGFPGGRWLAVPWPRLAPSPRWRSPACGRARRPRLWRLPTVASDAVIASVSGGGTVAAVRSLDLPFQTGGTVTGVLVETGDTVTAAQHLARLDDRSLQLDVANAQASLQSAHARPAQV